MMKWKGLWYQPEYKYYNGQSFNLEELSENKNAKVIVRHNPYWNKTNNTPRYQYKVVPLDYEIDDDNQQRLSFNEVLEDAARIINLMISDIEYGDYSQAKSTGYDFLEHWGV